MVEHRTLGARSVQRLAGLALAILGFAGSIRRYLPRRATLSSAARSGLVIAAKGRPGRLAAWWPRLRTGVLGAALSLGAALPASAAVYNWPGPAVCIPSICSSTIGITDTVINVPATFAIVDVNVTLIFDHTYFEDLVVYLLSPSGTLVDLFSNPPPAAIPTGLMYSTTKRQGAWALATLLEELSNRWTP